MRQLLVHLRRLPTAKRVAIGSLLVLLALTWLAACLVVASVWVH